MRSVVDEYIQAREHGDAAKICSLYTSELREQQKLEPDCPTKLREQLAAEPQGTSTTIDQIKVHDNLSRVDLDVSQGGAPPSRVTLGLIDKDGRWLIARVP